MVRWLAQSGPVSTSVGLLLVRGFVGLGFVAHGWSKLAGEHGLAGFAGWLGSLGVPMPGLAAGLSAGTELVGGALLAAGLLTRVAAVPMAFNMLVAAFLAHGGSYFITNNPPGMEYALNLAAVLTALALTGPGRVSLDALLFRGVDQGAPAVGGAAAGTTPAGRGSRMPERARSA